MDFGLPLFYQSIIFIIKTLAYYLGMASVMPTGEADNIRTDLKDRSMRYSVLTSNNHFKATWTFAVIVFTITEYTYTQQSAHVVCVSV